MNHASLVLGVDGGGTKSLGLLADEFGNVLAEHTKGASNPNFIGFEGAADNLYSLVIACCTEARRRPEEIGLCLFGLAGAGQEENRRRLANEIRSRFVRDGREPLHIAIETDARVALEGAFDGDPGIIVIAGTGSVVMGKTLTSEITSVGGWGRVLGDGGSGYAIGLEAIKAVTLDVDGRREAKKLRLALSERFGWSSREAIIDAVYQKKFDIPSLAPLVLDVAAQGDAVARVILENGASELAEQVGALVHQMGGAERVGVVFVGGLIGHDTAYAEILRARLGQLVPQAEIRAAQHPPAYGAVLMALKKLKRA